MTHKKIKGGFETYVQLFKKITGSKIKELMIFNEHIEPLRNSTHSRLTVEFKIVKEEENIDTQPKVVNDYFDNCRKQNKIPYLHELADKLGFTVCRPDTDAHGLTPFECKIYRREKE